MPETFEIGTVRCEPGTRATGYIESVYLRDASQVRIPLIVLHGNGPGPVLWVGAAVHGNEIPGWEVIRRLTREVLDPRTLRGTLVAAPVQNPLGYMESSRLTPQDGMDINRIFPGDPNGSLTQRLAHDLFHQGLARADAVLDIHSNAPSAVSFNIVRSGGKGPQWEAQFALAEVFGISIAVSPVGEAAIRGGTLHDAVVAAGKPALTVELSGAHFWEEPSVRAGV
ncbi:MAG: succinylglutamate desuccinylase/aspartoacylase family protein, partial [Armatimonadetes bacterium]|nr:succinylglutamate desuccinylase/aspartoacylase family protein [Armatimonadota bacterium]